MKEHRVGIRELKANLSSVLRQVKTGKTIVITERGRSVGKIVPAEESTLDLIEDGVRKRLWSWSGRKWKPGTPKVRPHKGAQVSDLLLDDRE